MSGKRSGRPPRGARKSRDCIELGAVAEQIAYLDVACTRCDRRGRLSTARLLARYSPAQSLPELRRLLAGDCPRLISPAYGEQCDPHFPQLLRLFAEQGRGFARTNDCSASSQVQVGKPRGGSVGPV